MLYVIAIVIWRKRVAAVLDVSDQGADQRKHLSQFIGFAADHNLELLSTMHAHVQEQVY